MTTKMAGSAVACVIPIRPGGLAVLPARNTERWYLVQGMVRSLLGSLLDYLEALAFLVDALHDLGVLVFVRLHFRQFLRLLFGKTSLLLTFYLSKLILFEILIFRSFPAFTLL